MNERIKELALQAEQYAFDKANEGDDDDYECLFDLDFRQKFAELIVRECCDLLETSLPYNPQQKMIKKHFGVE